MRKVSPKRRGFLFESEEKKSDVEALYDAIKEKLGTAPISHDGVFFVYEALKKEGIPTFLCDSVREVMWNASPKAIGKSLETQVKTDSNGNFREWVKVDLEQLKSALEKAMARLDDYENVKTSEEDDEIVLALIDASRMVADAKAAGRRIDTYPPWNLVLQVKKVLEKDPYVKTGDALKNLQRAVLEARETGDIDAISKKEIDLFVEKATQGKKIAAALDSRRSELFTDEFIKFLTEMLKISKQVRGFASKQVKKLTQSIERSPGFLLDSISNLVRLGDSYPTGVKKEYVPYIATDYPKICANYLLADDPDELVKKFEKKIEEWLDKEEEKLKDYAEVPEKDIGSAPWGRVAFANHRSDEVPGERNTKEEQEVLKGVLDHVTANVPIPAETDDEIKKILKKGWYEPVIKEPKEEYAYRGMSVSKEWLLNAGIDVEGKESGEEEKSYRYISSRPGTSSSWSTSKKAAVTFLMPGKDGFLVLLTAKISKNKNSFIVGEDGLYKLAALDSFKHEKEAIAIDDIIVDKIKWANPRTVPMSFFNEK